MADYDVVIIGAGPGGYVAAIRAAQLGMKTVVVERDELGGICLNWGCIPTKSLLRNAEVLGLFRRAEEFGIHVDGLTHDFGAAIDRSRKVATRLTRGVTYLFRKNGVEHIVGEGVLRGPGQVEVKGTGQVIEASSVIVATGARSRTLPNLPVDGRLVMTSREALERKDLPESVVIVGGGAIGCEFAYLYNAYGVRVTVIELLPRLLPLEDPEVSQQLERAFRVQGITVLTGTKIVGYEASNGADGIAVNLETPSGNESLTAAAALEAVGIQGNTEDIGLEAAGVATERGFIVIDEGMRTNVPSIFAIGDVTGKLPLAHVASAQGVAVVEALAGLDTAPLDYGIVPRAVYCQPQVASWGLSEEAAREAGHEIQVGRFPFTANGKALGLGEPQGSVKLVVDARYGAILGAHLIGPDVTELLAELSMTRALEGTADELGAMVHAHPSLSEALKEAALAARGQPIHL